MEGRFLEWLNMEINNQEHLYRQSEGSRKRNINARLLTLKEVRNRYKEANCVQTV